MLAFIGFVALCIGAVVIGIGVQLYLNFLREEREWKELVSRVNDRGLRHTMNAVRNASTPKDLVG